MILDRLQMFDAPPSGRDLTGAAGTYLSTDTLDYGILSGIPSSANGGGARDMGIGDKPALKLLAQVITAGAGGTSLQITLQGAVDDGAGAPSTFSNWWQSPVYTLAQLVQGARLLDMDFPRPPQGVAIPRFVRLSYATLGTFTALGLVSGVVLDRPDHPYLSTDNSKLGGYPAGITVPN